ncbi:hypothetical protein [Paraburkholderia strydomiana]
MSDAPMNAAVSASDMRVVERGREAWKTIKASRAVLHREWYALGKAFEVGRKATPNGIVFRRWCGFNGMGGISAMTQAGIEEYARADSPHSSLPLAILEWYRDRDIALTTRPRGMPYRDATPSKDLPKAGANEPNLVEVIARGQAAWASIKEKRGARRALSRGSGAKAQERRDNLKSQHLKWWREIGEALEVGKNLNAGGRYGAYSAWLKAKGFDDIPDRSSAIWFSASAEALGDTPGDMTSPSSIRAWVYQREAAKRAPAPTAEDVSLQAAAEAIRQASVEMTRCVQALRSAIRVVEHAQQELRGAMRLRAHERSKAETKDRDQPHRVIA